MIAFLYFCRQIIENHQLENHPGSPTQIQTIRDLTADEIEELCREARYQSDSSYIRNPGIGSFSNQLVFE